MATFFDRNQPVLLQPANETEAEPLPSPAAELPPSRFGAGALLFAGLLSLFWVGIWTAYLWGYLGPQGLAALNLQSQAMFGGAMLLPPVLFFAVAAILLRAHTIGRSSDALLAASERLFAVDDTAARAAVRLGRVVRRELDGMNAGLDAAFARLRVLETSLENQIAALDEAGARAEVRGDAIAARLGQESQRLETLSDHLTESATRASETVAGRAAQLKAAIETAEGSLKMAAQQLDVQAAGFRAATNAAAELPHAAAVELDDQAKKIEAVSDAALSRAELR